MAGVAAFGNSEYDAVRTAMDLRLTADQLPNAVIAQSIFEGEAKRYVDSNVSEATISGNAAQATACAVLYAAGLILPSLPQVVREDIPGGTMIFQGRDLLAAAAERKSEAATILAMLQDKDAAPVTTTLPMMFDKGEASCHHR